MKSLSAAFRKTTLSHWKQGSHSVGQNRRLNAAAGKYKILSDKAWADYELRRDQYIKLAELVSCLFTGDNTSRKTEFHEVARAVRLVGSDEVVTALNTFTAAIKNSRPQAELERCYRDLFDAMRQDIREIHECHRKAFRSAPVPFRLRIKALATLYLWSFGFFEYSEVSDGTSSLWASSSF
jgi:hypothetical protein